MADFRRPPEWHQEADRHSVLIDPVLTVRPISRFDYTARRPTTPIDHALVFVTTQNTYETFLPPHRPTRADAASRRYTSVYEVDMGIHPVQVELELPSAGDAFQFTVTADLTWQVTDPTRFVTSGERDVPARLRRELQGRARVVSRRFPIEESAAAEEAVTKEVVVDGLAADIGLHTTCVVQVSTDDAAIAHQMRQRELRHQNELLGSEHELRLRQAHQEHELAALRQRQMEELATRRIEYYQHHLQYGGVGAWAVHLAEHPEDTQLVLNNITRDQLTLIRSQLELISTGTLEDYQQAEAARKTLGAVDDLLRQTPPSALPHAAEHGQLPPGSDMEPGAELDGGTAQDGIRHKEDEGLTAPQEREPDAARSGQPPEPPRPTFPPGPTARPPSSEDDPWRKPQDAGPRQPPEDGSPYRHGHA
ncbi:SPFH domain-containing protein [Streptomyces sp. TS71-3]|uniref:SPFH domain-containing protein n=1 Tax=Streptomyces sp. TS71-3 TaxID=2733862 RepID=UPI001B0E7018|nr:SPFH domain-containing protein [Streptomyces sp. TS71-3]GHJ34933.1 hypothetical protein Sm713_05420 [Streptomyces sp. TS71-3]